MKVGDLVTNVYPVHTNTEVHNKRYEKGHFGIVTKVRQTDMNKQYSAGGKGDLYVDVTLNAEDGTISCGNYLGSFFKVIS